MDELHTRAMSQKIINTLDFKRVTAKMDSDALLSFKALVTVIDSVNDRKIPSLFKRDESIIQRSILQGGISASDYGKLSVEDKQQVALNTLRIENDMQTVDVFEQESILRSDFEKMDTAQKQEVMNNKTPLIDKAPIAPYSVEELQGLSKVFRMAL